MLNRRSSYCICWIIFLNILGMSGGLTCGAYAQQVQQVSPQASELIPKRKILTDSERKLLSLEAKMALLTGMSRVPQEPTWEPVAWVQAVREAPQVTPLELLKQSKGVRLSLKSSSQARKLLNDQEDNPWPVVMDAVARRGIDVRSNAEASIDLLIYVDSLEVTRGQQSLGEGHLVECVAEFKVPARLIRGERLIHSNVTVTHAKSMRWSADELSPQDLVTALDHTLDALVARMQEISKREPAQVDMFELWLSGVDGDVVVGGDQWQDAGQTQYGQHTQHNQHAKQYQAFVESYCDDTRDLSADLDGLVGLSSVYVGYMGPGESLGLPRYQKSPSQTQVCEKRMSDLNMPLNIKSAPALNHLIWGERIQGGGPLSGNTHWSSRLSVYEPDCLGVVDGQLVRFSGDSYSDNQTRGVTSDRDLDQKVKAGLHAQMNRFASHLTPNGQANRLAVRHPDADAVANFLKTRQRVQVPDDVLAEVSQRIALTLATAPGITQKRRAQWVIQKNGQRLYNLPRVGDARRAGLVPRQEQQAIREAIDAIIVADPIGLFAFNQPFSHNEDHDTVLPDTFVDRLNRLRPSGAGALRCVTISDAADVAFKLSGFYVKREQEQAVRNLLRSKSSLLKKQPVLIAEYIPEDGKASYTQVRYFRTGATDLDWEEILSQLPSEIQPHRIGPWIEMVPDTLAEADALFGE